ncbi:MAG: hypothetical protein A4E53_01612 [Pelotomaculum sp. PtaB.Bin104]|nr:MAG: hypothetical protein A4E53_01612 [Pelotomaculum sp. PtaB.Bin104]
MTIRELEKGSCSGPAPAGVGQHQVNNLENCLICGNKLDYLEWGREFSCIYCGKKEVGYVYCPGGHYVCDHCHGKGLYEQILNMAITSQGTDPLKIAETMMKAAPIPMLGCEHAWISAGALLAAIKNTGEINITENRIAEALARTKKQAIGAYCGLTGICGIAPAIGSCFSVILSAACSKDQETATTMRVVSQVIGALAGQTGPCCCKNFVRTALTLGCKLVRQILNIALVCDGELVCGDSSRHPHGCRKEKCHYYK